jgi:hypothetical protein
LSLVAKTFLDFAIGYEPIIRKRMEEMWPALKDMISKQDAVLAKQTGVKKNMTRKK